jgi:hypothetical protein
MTRKRKFYDATDIFPRKRRAQIVNNPRNKHEHTHNDDPRVSHELLSLYYPRIVSLRQFLLSSLPLSSTSRRRRVSAYGSDSQAGTRQPHFFDSTLVGVFPEPRSTVRETRKREFATFTQSQQKSTDSSNGSTQGHRFAEVSNPARQKLFRTRAGLDVNLGSTDIFRLWNLLSGRCFIERHPHLRDRTIFFAMVFSEAQRIVRKNRWELSPA